MDGHMTMAHTMLACRAVKPAGEIKVWLGHIIHVFNVDDLMYLESAIARNADRAVLTSEHQTRQRMLSRELQHVNRSHRTEVCNRLFHNHLMCMFEW